MIFMKESFFQRVQILTLMFYSLLSSMYQTATWPKQAL